LWYQHQKNAAGKTQKVQPSGIFMIKKAICLWEIAVILATEKANFLLSFQNLRRLYISCQLKVKSTVVQLQLVLLFLLLPGFKS
jgi:hypothetical protein